MSVTAVVLAAGAARRLGRPKQLEQVGGIPLVARALAASAPADNRLVMLGAAAHLIQPTVLRYAPDAAIVVADEWRLGMGAVLAAAIRTIPEQTQAVVVLLADQPFVTGAAVSALIKAWHRTGQSWICAGYADRPGHPHVFSRTWFESLSQLAGDDGARAVTAGHRPLVVAVPGDDRDIDDESDLVTLRAEAQVMSECRLLTGRQPAAISAKRRLPTVAGADPGGSGASQPVPLSLSRFATTTD